MRFFLTWKVLNLNISPLLLITKKWASHVHRETANEKKMFKIKNHGYIIHTWWDKALKGTVVNRALSSLQEVHLKLRLQLQSLFNWKILNWSWISLICFISNGFIAEESRIQCNQLMKCHIYNLLVYWNLNQITFCHRDKVWAAK